MLNNSQADFENTRQDVENPKCLGTLQGRGVLLPEPGLHLAAYLKVEDLSTVVLRTAGQTLHRGYQVGSYFH